jgi:peptide/nickel transport system ATP-binding protein
MTAPVILEARSAHKTYPGRQRGKAVAALHPLDLKITSEPKILAIVGESGSGKSTLAGMMLGFVSPTSGEILHRNRPLRSLRGKELIAYRREVQAVFQDPYSSFNPFYRVEHALVTPLLNLGIAANRREARKIIDAACVQVGLDPGLVIGRFAHQLSGGQRQRLMVARALMLRPKVLIADEPVSMVDASLRMSILDALKTLRDEYGIVVIYITHDLATAYRVSDQVMVLQKGHVVEEGSPEQVLRQPTHSYTRTLIDSIPWPDPDRAWGGDERRIA